MACNMTDQMGVGHCKTLEPDHTYILGKELGSMIRLILIGFGSTILSGLGIVTNVINIIVFTHQEMADGVSLSLRSLALTDCMSCVCTLFIGLCFVAENFDFLEHLIDWLDFMEIAFSWPRGMFMGISMVTTVWISMERTLCIVMPLKVKSFITPTKTAAILVFIYVFVISCYTPVFATYGLKWEFNENTNTSKLIQYYTQMRKDAELFTFLVVNFSIPIVCFITVVICTYAMVIGLYSSAKFRMRSTTRPQRQTSLNTKKCNTNSTNGGESASTNICNSSESVPSNQSGFSKQENCHSVSTLSTRLSNMKFRTSRSAISATKNNAESAVDLDETYLKNHLTSKDKRTVMVVILVAIVFILCTIPYVAIAVSTRVVPGFGSDGKYEDLLLLMFAIVIFVGSINTFINIFIYLKASSKYQDIFWQMFCPAKKSP